MQQIAGIRVAGVNIPAHKHIGIALRTSIYGIGPSRAEKICAAVGIDPTAKVQSLSESILDAIRLEVSKYKVESELRREVLGNIRRLEMIKSYRGLRHFHRLPVRGQRTRTNARTRKGPRKLISKH